MSFYLQMGYGKSDRIQRLSGYGKLSGAILSPADEDTSQLLVTADLCRQYEVPVLVDPQTHIYSLNPLGTGRKHSDNGIAFKPLRWAMGPKDINAIIAAIGQLNNHLGAVRWIAPTCIQNSFDSIWTPLSIQFASAAVEAWGGDRTIITLAIDEAALSSWRAIQDWLDEITTLDAVGFYVIIHRANRNYPPNLWGEDRYVNLLRLVYRLSILNEYEVIWGYSDLDGLIGLAAGATGMASGWHYSLRTASAQKWQPSGMAKQPAPRVTLSRLWAPLRASGEADRLLESATGEEVTSFVHSDFACNSQEEFENINRSDAQMQYLQTVSSMARGIAKKGTVENRMTAVQNSLSRALRRYEELERERIILPAPYKARVKDMLSALEAFSALEL